MNSLESEFLEYQATPYDEFPVYFDKDDKPMCIDHICHQISKQIDLHSGSIYSEHIQYNQKVRKICTDGHHNLVKDAKQGHASTSG